MSDIVCNSASDVLLDQFWRCGVDICFANPGTSELGIVKSLARSQIRPVLCLSEGVAAGAADGFGRMSGRAALTLTHLGPGFAGAIQNLHNAKRARTPLINLIGQNPVAHTRSYDVGLNSDIESLARPVTHRFEVVDAAGDVAELAARAVSDALADGGAMVTLALPSDVQEMPASSLPPKERSPAAERIFAPARADALDRAAQAIRDGRRVVILLGGNGTAPDSQLAAAAIAHRYPDVRLYLDTFCAILPRGADLPPIGKLPYFSDAAIAALQGADYVLLAGAAAPVAYFHRAGLPDEFSPPGSAHVLASPEQDAEAAILWLARLVDAAGPAPLLGPEPPELPDRETALTPDLLGPIIAANLPADAIVSVESPSAGPGFGRAQLSAPRHVTLGLTGGAIGQGLPVALGAALACPGRPVYALESDGSGVYTLPALWTMVREEVPVTIIIAANQRYEILNVELALSGMAAIPDRIRALTDLSSPTMDWVAIARGFGMEACAVSTCGELVDALASRDGARMPFLIQANV